MKIVTWNVNGWRAILRKGFVDIYGELKADIMLIQETKTNAPLPVPLPGVRQEWQCGQRAGYSGTLALVRDGIRYTRLEPPELLAAEGRTIALELDDFYLLGTYFPNGGQGPVRLQYKMDFYAAYLAYVQDLAKSKPVIFAGDVNTAHREIDLARPKENRAHTGFLPMECAWLDEVEAAGFVDVWRARHPEQAAYSWWDYKTRSRERDVGWRIDYFWANQRLTDRVKACEILTEVMGSDHAPVLLEI